MPVETGVVPPAPVEVVGLFSSEIGGSQELAVEKMQALIDTVRAASSSLLAGACKFGL
jgi:hypothetical protein